MRRWIAIAAFASACRPAPAAPAADRPPADRPPAPRPTARLLERLALLATQRVPDADELARTAQAVDADPAQLAAYVDRLLRDPRFATEVVPPMFLVAGTLHPTGYVLQSTRAGSELIYYLRRPCAPEVAESVEPWWAPTTTVRVCPDSHRPAYLARPGTGWQCGSTKLNLEAADDCGCGPHLARCFRNAQHRDAVRTSLRRENTRTIAWIVEHDLPLETLFTANETFRDYTAELVYTSWRVLEGETVRYPDAADWPREGKWAARPESRPGMHAGMLTTPYTLMSGDATRALMRELYELVWCKAPASSHVDAQTIWSLGVTDLRSGAGWQRLAAMPVCTSCHARLDHGAQFFSGFPGTLYSEHYLPSLQQSGEGPLYGDDIDDPRGRAERTPAGFARAALAQGEFTGCMVERVARAMFGGPAPADAATAMREELTRSHSIRAMARVALLREAATWQRGAPDIAANSAATWPAPAGPASSPAAITSPAGTLPANTPPASTPAMIAPSPALRGELERTCADCHADGPRAFTQKPALERPLVERMLRAVAFEDMPRQPAVLPPDRRRAMVRELIAALFADEPSREVARRAFEAPTRWRAPLPEGARLAAVHAHTGVPEAARPALDAAYYAGERPAGARHPLSATMLLDLATVALADCARLGDADRRACLDRALRLDELLTPDAE